MKSLWRRIVYWFKSRTKEPIITMELEEIAATGYRTFYCVHVFNHGHKIAFHDFTKKPTKRHLHSLYKDYMGK